MHTYYGKASFTRNSFSYNNITNVNIIIAPPPLPSSEKENTPKYERCIDGQSSSLDNNHHDLQKELVQKLSNHKSKVDREQNGTGNFRIVGFKIS